MDVNNPYIQEMDFNLRSQEVQSLLWRLEPSPYIDEIEHQLKGQRYDEKLEEWVKYCSPLANDEGVNTIIRSMRIILNKNNVQSNLTMEDINRITMQVKLTIAHLIKSNAKNWEIEFCNQDSIVYAVEHQAYIFLMRAFDNGERNIIAGTEKRVEQTIRNYNQDEQNKFKLFK